MILELSEIFQTSFSPSEISGVVGVLGCGTDILSYCSVTWSDHYWERQMDLVSLTG